MGSVSCLISKYTLTGLETTTSQIKDTICLISMLNIWTPFLLPR
jgi:hypothetical protein